MYQTADSDLPSLVDSTEEHPHFLRQFSSVSSYSFFSSFSFSSLWLLKFLLLLHYRSFLLLNLIRVLNHFQEILLCFSQRIVPKILGILPRISSFVSCEQLYRGLFSHRFRYIWWDHQGSNGMACFHHVACFSPAVRLAVAHTADNWSGLLSYLLLMWCQLIGQMAPLFLLWLDVISFLPSCGSLIQSSFLLLPTSLN